MNTSTAWLAVCLAALLLITGEVQMASAAGCNPVQLSPCMPAIKSGRPTRVCCTRLSEQRPCLCGYARNPNLQKLIRSPGGMKIAKACRVSIPRC